MTRTEAMQIVYRDAIELEFPPEELIDLLLDYIAWQTDELENSK